jgi:hypothetical protein
MGQVRRSDEPLMYCDDLFRREPLPLHLSVLLSRWVLIQVEETLSGRSPGPEKPCVLTARACAAKRLWSRKFSTLANIGNVLRFIATRVILRLREASYV